MEKWIDKNKLKHLSFSDLYALHKILKKEGKYDISSNIDADNVKRYIDERIESLLEDDTPHIQNVLKF